MKKVIRNIFIATGLSFLSALSFASFQDDISTIESKIPKNFFCQHCSVIQNVDFLSFNEKDNEIIFEMNVVSNKTNFINLNIPINSLEILEASLENNNSPLLMRRDNNGYLYGVVPSGEVKVLIKAKMLESKIPLSFFDAKISSKIGQDKLTLSTIGNQLYLVKSGSDLNIDSGKRLNKVQNFTLNSDALFQVERKLILGKTWYLETTVTSLFNNSKDYIKVNNQVKIPLIPGEKIISENKRVEDGFVLVNLDRDESQSWRSTVDSLSKIDIKPISENVLQHFSIDEANTDWLFNIEKNGEKVKATILDLWPQDSLVINFDLPQSKKGDFNVVKSVNISSRLGKNDIKNTWEVKVESSLGGSFTIDRNNDKSQILTFKKIDGTDINYQQDGSKLTFFLESGNNTFNIETIEQRKPQLIEENAKWDFGVPTYNYRLQMYNDGDRWILWAGGDMVKPSVLLLGYIILVAIFSFFLAKLSPMFNGFTWALILFGLTNMPMFLVLLLVLSLAIIAKKESDLSSNTIELGALNHWTKIIVFCSVYAVGVMVCSAAIGLLGSPESFIVSIYGNSDLVWMTDIYNKTDAYILSLPQYYFKIFMFLWSLWLAFIIVKIITVVIGFIKRINE